MALRSKLTLFTPFTLFTLFTGPVMVAAALLAFALPLAAADGILIVQKTTTGGTTRINQLQIEKDRMRADNVNLGGPEKQTFLFDGSKQVMWVINQEKKVYAEVTKADIDRLGAQVSDTMALMRQQMANLPPEQRAKVEAMMRGRGLPPGALAPTPPKTEYKKTGTDTVGKWTCAKYEGSINDLKTVELCTVEPEALGFSAADFEISRQLAAFFAKFRPQGTDNLFFGTLEEQGFSGIPVRLATFGATTSTSEITSVSREKFPDGSFAVPAGFQRIEAPFGGRGRGRQ